ncbi:uncharacterized protein LOC144545301 [Carex rostrata]
MTISIQYVNEEGGNFNHDIVTMGNVKFARFKVGTMTIEISSAQDVNSDNPPTMPNTRQNTATTNMVSGAGSSLPGAHEPSLQLGGQKNSISSSQSNEPIQRIEKLQIAESIQGSETRQVTGSIHGSVATPIQNQINVEGDDDFIRRMSGWLMTVATILMGMAFQSGMSVPGGYWSETKINSSSASIDSSNDTRHTAGQPIIMNMDHYRYISFLILNIAAFGTSMLVIILLLFKKFPRHRLLSIRWLLVYAMGIIALVYALGCAPKFLYALYISALLVNCMFFVLIFWAIWLLSEVLWRAAPVLWTHMRSMGNCIFRNIR